MLVPIIYALLLGLGAAALLDLWLALASGVLAFAGADRTTTPRLFWSCAMAEAASVIGVTAWLMITTFS